MSAKSNRVGLFGPLLALVIVSAAVYVREPKFRNFVDEKCPWVKEHIGKYAPLLDARMAKTPNGTPAPAPDSTPASNPAAADAPSASEPQPEAKPDPAASVPKASAPAVVKPAFDLQRVCADPALWPKTVALKRNVYFPAVLNGKSIGTLRAPKGAEARLVTIQSGKLGVEYQGGGAWLDFDSTDFEERARLAYH